MDITFKCAGCGQPMEADSGLCGTSAECPACGANVLIPSPPIEKGSVLGGFRIERRLGKGAMGEVYLATQLSMNREVALKVLPLDLTRDQEYVERFTNEVRMLGRLNHPNIVTAFEAGSDMGYHYLAMLYVEGVSLEARLSREGALPEKEALLIVHSVAHALAYAWDTFQILHRDIKPDNIMLDKGGNVRLMDMGISKQVTEDTGLTMAGDIMGTPEYMSPEQAKGKMTLDCRADIYSLGATLYHLVTGRLPFKGDSTMSVLSQLLTENYLPVRDANPNVSEGCAGLIDKMMMKDAAARYQNWEKLIADLQQLLKGRRPRFAGRPAVPAPAAPPRPVFKRPLFVGAAAVLVLGAAAAVLIVTNQPAPRRVSALPPPPQAPASPLPRPPDSAAPAAPDPIKAIEDMFETAREYARTHPADYDGAIRKFRSVVQDGARTKFKLKAEDEISSLLEARGKAVTNVLARLKNDAEPLVKAERFDEAAAIFNDYKGPFAAEMESERRAQAALVDAGRKDAVKRKEDLARAGAGKKEKLLKDLAGLVLSQEFTKASEYLAAARKDEALTSASDLGALAGELQDTARMPEIIRQSFQSEIGKQVTIQLKGEKETLHISSVAADGTVQGKKLIKIGNSEGSISKSFTLADLSIEERFKRLAKEQGSSAEMMRGILLFQAHRREQAIKCFEGAGTALGKAIVAHLATPAPASAPSSGEAETDAAEEAAKEAYKDLLRTGNLPVAEKSDSAVVSVLRTRAYTKDSVAKVRAQVAAFRKDFGTAKIAREHAAVLLALDGIMPFSKQRLDKTMADLIKANPPLKNGFRHSEELSEGGLTVMLENNPGLSDISALRDLPITVLALNNTKVKDITPLKGMPLDDLGLWNTKVDDIRVLRGMPITVLSLNATGIDNIKALEGMKLTWLDLSFTAVDDIGILRGMPLQTVKLDGCERLLDISVLENCADLSAVILPPKVKQVSFLKKLPNLRFIGTNWKEAEMAADAFWAKYGSRFK